MKINSALNLVIPLQTDNGTVNFHSRPLRRETFEKYYMVISMAFTRLIENGLELTGARVAAMHLKSVAQSIGQWEGAEGVQNGLFEEIARLTSVLVLTETGWDSLPVNVAIGREYISEDDWEDAKQGIVFFILISAMTKGNVRAGFLASLCSSWEMQTTSLTDTDFAGSLPILTETVSLPTPTSSVPI